jgi:formylglycine-generating enzyme required for sulfatase activity
MPEDHASVDGSGSIAQDQGVAAGERGGAVGGSAHQSPIVTGDRNVVTINYLGQPVEIPSGEAIRAHRAALRRKLEDDAQQRWGGMGAYIREEGARLPIEASPYQIGAGASRHDLLSRMREAHRLLVLGEPGSGKTVALDRLAWELCDGDLPLLPVPIPLLYYTGEALEKWVRSRLQAMGHLRLDDERALAAFLKQAQVTCYLLFDGLNEVPRQHAQHFVSEFVRWLGNYPEHPVILTGRSQDDLWSIVRSEVDQALVIQPITPEQIASYLRDALGGERGQALFDRLDPRLRALAERPLLLYLMKEAAAAGESLPGNRGELYARFVSRLLRRDTERKLDAEIPERTKHQVATHLGYALHRQDTLTCPWDTAVGIVSAMLEEPQAEETLGALCRHGLLVRDEDLVRFPHQTIQEHFTAVALVERIEAQRTCSPILRPFHAVRQRLSGTEETLASLSIDERWTEPFIQLAGLINDPEWLIRHVGRRAPWLAWWCVQEGRQVDPDTRRWAEERSGKLLRSGNPKVRRRAVRTLIQLQDDRVVDPLFFAAGDPDWEVAREAAHALMQRGEATRRRARTMLKAEDARERRAGLACLPGLLPSVRPEDTDLLADIAHGLQLALDMPMVYVPPGPFLMGSDPTVDEKAYGDEQPQHEVNLPGFWIGRHPVTTAQFRALVQESGYTRQDKRSLQGKADHPMVWVSWRDAMGYCRWLAERTGLSVKIPSEAEWEKAARGTDGRIYPWGNTFDSTRCNSYESGIVGTTPVGKFSPAGDSPYGCADMAGNVWEWTRSLWGRAFDKPDYGYPYGPEDGREALHAGNDVFRVVRGGSFDRYEGLVRCTCRGRVYPNRLLDRHGFRVVVAPV